jgi:Fic family protein
MTKTRTYIKTHKWITFRGDFQKAGPKFWALVGEANSLCGQIGHFPLKPALARHLNTVYLTKGVGGTTAIEGNTLTEQQVEERIKGKLKLPPSQEYLGQEIDNIVKSINAIAQEVVQKGCTLNLSVEDLKKYNAGVLYKLKLDEDVIPGEIRKLSVAVMNYRGAPSQDCEYLLIRLCDWLNGSNFDELDRYGEGKIVSGIFKAILAHLYIAWIHPFGDGNGRVARLVEFLILFQSGVPSIAAHLLSNHYNLTRTEYYKQLESASSSGGEVVPFLQYALQGFVDGLKEQSQTVQGQQLVFAWQNYVHEQFQAKATKTNKRRRDLVLSMSPQRELVPIGQIKVIDPKTAAAYANLSMVTLIRDLAILKKMDLVIQEVDGYRVKIEKIQGFMPFSIQQDD